MAKKSKSSEKAEKKDKPKKKRVTITSIVLACLDKDPEMECLDIYHKIVAGGFPDTKFSKSHLAWYKYKVRKGELKLPSGKALPPARRGRKKKAKDENDTEKSKAKKPKKKNKDKKKKKKK